MLRKSKRCEQIVLSAPAAHQINLEKYNSNYTLCEVAIPRCEPDCLLVQVHAAGYCHSDLQVLQGQFGSKLPMIPSHEPAGKIVEVGSAVDGDWKVGDRVGVLNYRNACKKCPSCLQHLRRTQRVDPRFCEKRQTSGFQNDGAFAQFMLADPDTTIRLPEGISFEQGAPLMCAGVS